ncbi:MAG TPA: hypothetical protein VN754_15060 [Candidatus Binataceae bacterium]|nr:hypothetical protein [Candidatus Binataceae bacterium]
METKDDSIPSGLVKSKCARDTEPGPGNNPAKGFQPPNSITRRRLLQIGAGTGLAAVLAGSAGRAAGSSQTHDLATPGGRQRPAGVPKAPNIIVLMTDQERHHLHWPAGWAEKNLPGLQRLKRNGLYFDRAYTAGRFAPINRVTRTFLWPGLVHKNRQPNIASILKEKAGYEVVWKGKWHLETAAKIGPRRTSR